MLLVTLAVKVRQLGHDLACNAGSVFAAGVLNGGSLGVGRERQDEHSPAGLSCQFECRSQ